MKKKKSEGKINVYDTGRQDALHNPKGRGAVIASNEGVVSENLAKVKTEKFVKPKS